MNELGTNAAKLVSVLNYDGMPITADDIYSQIDGVISGTEKNDWLIWTIPLLAILFLWSLNEFMRGRFTQIISGVLALLIFGLILLAFIVSGWFLGLVALIGSFVLGAIFHYPAGLTASKLIK